MSSPGFELDTHNFHFQIQSKYFAILFHRRRWGVNPPSTLQWKFHRLLFRQRHCWVKQWVNGYPQRPKTGANLLWFRVRLGWGVGYRTCTFWGGYCLKAQTHWLCANRLLTKCIHDMELKKCDNVSTFFKHCVLGDFWDFYLGQTFLAYLRKDYPLTILLWPPNFQIHNGIFRTVLHFWDKNTALLFHGRMMKMLQKHWKVSQTSVMTSFPQGPELLQEAKERRSNWNMSLQPEQDWRYLPR